MAVAASSFPVNSKLKPFPALKAELPKPMASDLSPDRSIFHDASSSNPRRDLVFIVNPRGFSLFLSCISCLFLEKIQIKKQNLLFGAGANGRTGKDWKKLLPYLRSRLDKNCNVRAHFH